MSQFYDQASLVMVPSGYKAGKVYSQKPLSTDGELTFTRNSNATRVNADGLVEKVRTNVLLYSNTFSNAAWTVYSGSPTLTLVNNNATAPDGTQTASTLNYTVIGGGQQFFQNVSLPAGTYNTSIYLRSATGSSLSMTFGFYDGSNKNENITVGTTWQRFDVSKTLVNTTVRCCWLMANELNASVEIWNAQTEVSDFGPTEYIPTTSAAVSVGPTANVPRLNYSNGCPSLLLEPQRTNQTLYSEQFDNGWASSVTIVPNQAVSPDGYQNADLLYSTSSGSGKRVFRSSGITASTAYTFSVYAKAAGQNFIYFPDVDNSVNNVWFDLSNGTFSTPIEGTASMIDCGNGWYRCICTTTSTTTGGYSYIGISSSSGSTTFNTDGTTGVYVWGAQLEAGSYASSYIPTLGASVTRLADACLKNSITSLIGQAEGVIYAEVEMTEQTATNLVMSVRGSGYGDSQNFYFNQFRQVQSESYTSFVAQEIITSGAYEIGQRLKIALGYKTNDFALYINGVQIGTDTSGTIPASMPNLLLSPYNKVYAALLFKTRLTNAQLAELTTL